MLLCIDDNIIEAIQNTAKFLHEIGKINKIPSLKYDTSYLQEAKKLVDLDQQ